MSKKTMLNLAGMSCTSCANNIEKIIKSDKNVISAEVNFFSLTIHYSFYIFHFLSIYP